MAAGLSEARAGKAGIVKTLRDSFDGKKR